MTAEGNDTKKGKHLKKTIEPDVRKIKMSFYCVAGLFFTNSYHIYLLAYTGWTFLIQKSEIWNAPKTKVSKDSTWQHSRKFYNWPSVTYHSQNAGAFKMLHKIIINFLYKVDMKHK